MRTKALVTLAAMAASAFMAQADSSNVYSVNIVGYVNVPCVGTNTTTGARRYTLIANPLNNTAPNGNTFSNLFAALTGTIAQPSSVLKWDGIQFVTGNKISATGWSPASSASLTALPGEGIFVRTSVTSSGYTNTFVGEVMTGTMTNTMETGYNLVGNQVPIAGDATALGLTAAIPVNPLATANQLLKFNPATQLYVTHNRISTGWSPSVPFINVAEGFWIRNRGASSFDWTQTFNP